MWYRGPREIRSSTPKTRNIPSGETKLGEMLEVREFSLAEWQKMGFDTDSVVEDPAFIDPAHDDYRLSPHSPALRLGFIPVDFSKLGIRQLLPTLETYNRASGT